MKQEYFWKVPGVKAFPTILALSLRFHYPVSAVSPQPAVDDDDVQSWNDVPLTVPIHDRVDLVLTGTVRFGDNVRRLVDGRTMGRRDRATFTLFGPTGK